MHRKMKSICLPLMAVGRMETRLNCGEIRKVKSTDGARVREAGSGRSDKPSHTLGLETLPAAVLQKGFALHNTRAAPARDRNNL